MSIISTFDL